MWGKIIPIQNPLMLSHKYEPPRYAYNNHNMFVQQQQYQYQPHYQHSQQQQQHPKYPMCLQQDPLQQQQLHQVQQLQKALPALAPKTIATAASTSLIKHTTNTPLLRSYMKPLPKLPTDFDEQREMMSSTDDLSSRPHSPSMSSSDESYSKTTEGEGDLDEKQPRLPHNSQQLNQMNHRNGNPLQWLYPCDIQVDLTSPVIDLKDFEASSTTESQGQQTNTTQNKGDSCNSFEYHDRQPSTSNNSQQQGVSAVAKSPFERELQRLLQESSRVRNLQVAASSSNSLGGSLGVTGNISTSNEGTNEGNTTSNSSSRQNMDYSPSNSKLSSNNLGIDGSAPGTGTGTGTGGSNGNISVSNSLSGSNNNNNSHGKLSGDDLASPTIGHAKQNSRIPISTSFMISKHPVGLEAIKEIARNKNPSESSQMQTSDTESCEILHENRNIMNILPLATAGVMTNKSTTSTGTNYQKSPQQAQPPAMPKEHHNYRHRHRPRSKDFDQSRESIDQAGDETYNTEQTTQQQRYRHHHHHHHHHHHRQRNNQTKGNTVENEERDDTEDNLADEEFEDDEVNQDVKKQQQKQNQIEKSDNCAQIAPGMEVINDELKYGAGHQNHGQSLDSNPLESQSEWSDDDCREEATGGGESTGYITDEPGLENISLLNEAGLTDAEGALSDVNSLYNAPDVDDTSVSSRASSRLLSLDSLSGLYDCDLDSKNEMAIVNVSHKITNKFGPQQQQQQNI